MKTINRKKQIMLSVFLFLFSICITITVIPGLGVPSYGLFGDITSTCVSEETTEQMIVSNSYKHQKTVEQSVYHIFCAWFAILIAIVFLRYASYALRLPNQETIVTLKVRMDD